MTYRPIGIIPLRNYGWELSNYLRAPSRRTAWKNKARKGTSYGERTCFYTANGGNQRKPIHPGVRRIAAGTLYSKEWITRYVGDRDESFINYFAGDDRRERALSRWASIADAVCLDAMEFSLYLVLNALQFPTDAIS